MADYQTVYEPLVLTYPEAMDQLGYPEVEEMGGFLEETDFLFIGFNLREGSTQSDKFIRDGLISFVFGVRDGRMEIVASCPEKISTAWRSYEIGRPPGPTLSRGNTRYIKCVNLQNHKKVNSRKQLAQKSASMDWRE